MEENVASRPLLARQFEWLLQHCVVKITTGPNTWGTGFFVGNNLILTCAHVIRAAGSSLPVTWAGRHGIASPRERADLSKQDLALLHVEPTWRRRHPCVNLDPGVAAGDFCYVFGFSDQRPDGDPVLAQVDGQLGTMLKLRAGQVRPGHSGSPVLNLRTGHVCGIIQTTRDRSQDLGGIARIIADPQILSHNKTFTANCDAWERVRARASLDKLPDATVRRYLEAIVYQYENWGAFNHEVDGIGPTERRSMLISKMAASDLYHHYIPLSCHFFQPWFSGRSQENTRSKARKQFLLRLREAGWTHKSSKRRYAMPDSGKIDSLLELWSRTPEDAGAPRILLVLGDYGTGKSSVALHFVHMLARRRLVEPRRHSRIPIYVDLRDYRRVRRADEFLLEQLRNFDINLTPVKLNQWLSSGQVILIFDGFDEMSSRQSYAETLANFREILRVVAPESKLLLTSRTHYFRSDLEVTWILDNRAVTIKQPLLEALEQNSHYAVVEIDALSDDQIIEHLARRLPKAILDNIVTTLNTSYNLRDLAKRPVLLELICGGSGFLDSGISLGLTGSIRGETWV